MMRYIAMMMVMLVSGLCAAQTAPDGNAHPATQELSEAGKTLANPFGDHNTEQTKVASIAEKIAFAKAVDLRPLRDLAVFHNGRVKIWDTLGRETVQTIVGRKSYQDFVHEKAATGDGVTTYAYDPLFTLLDLTIDPAYYLDKPVIGVAYVPLREEMLDKIFPGTKEGDPLRDKDGKETKRGERERWIRLSRMTPLMVEQTLPEFANAHPEQDSWRRGVQQVDQGVGLFIECKANYLAVAPEKSTDPWMHISTLPESSEARKAALALGDAWRNMDVAKVNAAAAALGAALPKINAAQYPAGRRKLEDTYNRLNAFEWGFWAYALSLLTLLLAFGTGRKWLAALGGAFLFLALALHGSGFAMRCIIAERFAIQNQFESMTGLSLFAVIVGASIMVLRRQWLFGAAAAGVGFLVLITATQTKIPGQSIEREAAILNTSVLLKYHVTTVLSSYGLISLGMVVSLFYLGTHYAAKLAGAAQTPALAGGGMASVALGDDRGAIGTRARLLADLDTAQMIVLQLAFWTLGVGILLGAWWADHSWGRWWAFDPKETWALITWIVYLVVIHVRIASPSNKALSTAWLSVLGFIVMLWTYFGVNLLLPG
ncbi:MAG: cytochrome c biogenesis protein CcsA, partial [Phycisphaerales bacterium]